jgi:hypothetical protein
VHVEKMLRSGLDVNDTSIRERTLVKNSPRKSVSSN